VLLKKTKAHVRHENEHEHVSRVSITVSVLEVITRTSYILDKLSLRARGWNVSM